MTPHLAAFKRRWSYYTATGHARFLRDTDGRNALIRRVRDDLDRALRPTTRPVVNREFRKDSRKIDTPWTELPHEVIDDWRRRHPHATCSYRTECALAWLEQFRPVAS